MINGEPTQFQPLFLSLYKDIHEASQANEEVKLTYAEIAQLGAGSVFVS